MACAVAQCAAYARRWVEEKGRATRRADADADADADVDADADADADPADPDPADRAAAAADAAAIDSAGLRACHLAALTAAAPCVAGAGNLARRARAHAREGGGRWHGAAARAIAARGCRGRRVGAGRRAHASVDGRQRRDARQ